MGITLKKGDHAPEFKLKNSEGELKSLSDYAGQWLILYFYPKDNTPGCTTESKEFSQLLPEFQEKGAVVVGVSPDSEKSHQKFVDKHSLTVELLSDSEHSALNSYGVWQKKKMAGREYMGVVRSTFLINPDGIIENVWEKVRVKGHVESVNSTFCDLKEGS